MAAVDTLIGVVIFVAAACAASFVITLVDWGSVARAFKNRH